MFKIIKRMLSLYRFTRQDIKESAMQKIIKIIGLKNVILLSLKGMAVFLGGLLIISLVVFTLNILASASGDMSFKYQVNINDLFKQETKEYDAKILSETFYQRVSEKSFYQRFNRSSSGTDLTSAFMTNFKDFFSDLIDGSIFTKTNRYIKDANGQPLSDLKPALLALDSNAANFYRDYYDREKNVILSPALLSELNRVLFNDYGNDNSIKYPEQFIKPVHFTYDYLRDTEKVDPRSTVDKPRTYIDSYVYVTQRDNDGNVISLPSTSYQKLNGTWTTTARDKNIVYDYAVEKTNKIKKLYVGDILERNSNESYFKYQDSKGDFNLVKLYWIIPDNLLFNQNDYLNVTDDNGTPKTGVVGPFYRYEDAVKNVNKLSIVDKDGVKSYKLKYDETSSKFYNPEESILTPDNEEMFIPTKLNNRVYKHLQLAPLTNESGKVVANSLTILNINTVRQKIISPAYRSSKEYELKLKEFVKTNYTEELNHADMLSEMSYLNTRSGVALDISAMDTVKQNAIKDFENQLLDKGTLNKEWEYQYVTYDEDGNFVLDKSSKSIPVGKYEKINDNSNKFKGQYKLVENTTFYYDKKGTDGKIVLKDTDLKTNYKNNFRYVINNMDSNGNFDFTDTGIFIDSNNTIMKNDKVYIYEYESGKFKYYQALRVPMENQKLAITKDKEGNRYTEIPKEIKSIRDYGLGSILNYIEAIKVTFKQGTYWDESYDTATLNNTIKLNTNNRLSNENYITKGYYPQEVISNINQTLPPRSDGTRKNFFDDIVKSSSVRTTGRNNATMANEQMNVASDDEDTLSTNPPTNTNITGKYVPYIGGQGAGLDMTYDNPLDFYETWFKKRDYDDTKKGVPEMVGTLVSQDLKVAGKFKDRIKTAPTAKTYFNDIVSSGRIDYVKENIENLDQPFKYTDEGMAEHMFLIEEALTFAGRFDYSYKQTIQNVGTVDEKRPIDGVFYNRFQYVESYDFEIYYERIQLTSRSPEGEGPFYSMDDPDPYKVSASGVSSRTGANVFPNMKIYMPYNDLVNLFKSNGLSLDSYTEPYSKYIPGIKGYKVKGSVEKYSSPPGDIDFNSFTSLFVPDISRSQMSAFDTFGSDDFGTYHFLAHYRVKPIVKDYSLTPKFIPLYRNYSGNVREALPIENEVYFNGKDFNSWKSNIEITKDTKYTKLKNIQFETRQNFRYLYDYIMNFEAYIPLNVKSDTDFELRGVSGYAQNIAVTNNTPTTTTDVYKQEFLDEANQPYWEDLFKSKDMDKEKGKQYVAQILQGLAEEDRKNVPNQTISFYKNVLGVNIDPTQTNIDLINDALKSNKNYVEVNMGSSKVNIVLPKAGVMSLEMKDGIISTTQITKIKNSLSDINTLNGLLVLNGILNSGDNTNSQNIELKVNTGYKDSKDTDERLDPKKSIHFAGTKLYNILEDNNFDIERALMIYKTDESYFSELTDITNDWKNATDAQVKRAVELSTGTSDFDLTLYKPSVVTNVLGYVKDTGAKKQLVQNSRDVLTRNKLEQGSRVGPLVGTVKTNYGQIIQDEMERQGIEDFDINIIIAKVCQESGGKMVKGNGSPAWGIYQIEDTQHKPPYPYSRQIGDVRPGIDTLYPMNISKDEATDDRINIQKSTAWAVRNIHNIYYKYKTNKEDPAFDKDAAMKALIGYNMGEGGLEILINTYGDRWAENTDKVGGLLKLKKKYGSDYKNHLNEYVQKPHGDPDYLRHVLSYYDGDNQFELGNGFDANRTSGGLSLSDDVYKTMDFMIMMDFKQMLNYGIDDSFNGNNNGAFGFINHNSYDEAAALIDSIAAIKKGHKLVGTIVYNVMDFFGSLFTENPSANPMGNMSAANLDHLKQYMPYNIDNYRVPVSQNYALSSVFGMRMLNGVAQFHEGIDVSAPMNEPLYAINDGQVIKVSTNSNSGGYGYHIWIAHAVLEEGATYQGGPYYIISKYAHLSRQPNLRVGDMVSSGQLVGYVGNTGKSSPPPYPVHLHFEIGVEFLKSDPYNKTGKDWTCPQSMMDARDYNGKYLVFTSERDSRVQAHRKAINPYWFIRDEETSKKNTAETLKFSVTHLDTSYYNAE